MGNARYVGRVGALAVALGVGMAVASTPSIASAAPSERSSAASGESSSTTAPTAKKAKLKLAKFKQTVKRPVGTDSPGADRKPSGLRSRSGGDTTPRVAGDQDVAPSLSARRSSDGRLSIRPSQPGAFADAPVRSATVIFAKVASALQPPSPTPQRVAAVNVVSTFVSGVRSPGNGSPTQTPVLTAVLALVRDERERILVLRKATAAPAQTTSQLVDTTPGPSAVVDPADQRVLVIGVDGTNLSRILADPNNENFAALMADSTTAPATIVGHTTISNPSWTAILTGVWGERTGVINNVFTPWTYESYPTVFTQLEQLNPDIDTTAIANWDVINGIAGTGAEHVDDNVYVAQIEGDTNWLATDDVVAAKTIDAITSAEGPTFIFSYYVGVDENGHMYGGDSPEYAAAIENMDDNLGAIMYEVNTWNAAHPDDQWTVIVVTDHGHRPEKGIGHGFQTPAETETFVIANGPDFAQGNMNLQYQIVDTTPTVVTLFGGEPRDGSDGVSLLDLSAGNSAPEDLTQALQDAIALHGYPSVAATVRLNTRTVFATIPYFVFLYGNEAAASVPGFLSAPVQLIVNGVYVVTNVPAQIVARLTGVTGASIFPLRPPPPIDIPPAEDAMLLDSAIAV